jgi:uncharacterized membrane protein SirB2
MSVLSIFAQIEASAVGEAIRASLWLFPAIEACHLLALAVIGGSVLIVDLRLFGLGITNEPVSELWRDAQPWFAGSLTVMLISGLLLFTSEATKLYHLGAFWFKMTCLLLSILFAFTIRRKVAKAGANVPPLWSKLVAVVSVLLWAGVGVGGRWIGFS